MTDHAFRRALGLVALHNIAYFGIEFAVAVAIHSVSLFADSIDFLEDASLNLIVLAAIGWSARRRAQVGMLLAFVPLVPGAATLWTAIGQLVSPIVPAPGPLTLAGAGALAVNLTCAFVLASHRHGGGSLTKAAFLSARNDAFANVAIIATAAVTAFLWRSIWPDFIVGIAIAIVNAGAAWEVWQAARRERDASERA